MSDHHGKLDGPTMILRPWRGYTHHVHQFVELYGVWVCSCGIRPDAWIIAILEGRRWPVLPSQIEVVRLDDRRVDINFAFGLEEDE